MKTIFKRSLSTTLLFCLFCLFAFAATPLLAQSKPDSGLIDPKTNSITDGVPHALGGGKALINPGKP